MCVRGQKKKNRICCLVRANYPDNWLKFLSFVTGLEDTIFRQETKHHCSGGGFQPYPTLADHRSADSCQDLGAWLWLHSPREESRTGKQRFAGVETRPQRSQAKASALGLRMSSFQWVIFTGGVSVWGTSAPSFSHSHMVWAGPEKSFLRWKQVPCLHTPHTLSGKRSFRCYPGQATADTPGAWNTDGHWFYLPPSWSRSG